MIQEVTMYIAVCDACGKACDDEYAGWTDAFTAKEEAEYADWKEIDRKLYCPECYEWNDEGELVVRFKSAEK